MDSGEVEARKGNAILRASAIGSCVVVTAHDPECGVGAMAHVMLPGTSLNRQSSAGLKYAEDAMREMMRLLADLGAVRARLRVCLVGGGNMLGDDHDSPGPETAHSLLGFLHRMGLEPVATELGGTQRRSCVLDVARGRVTFTVGDAAERTLWENGVSGTGSPDKESS